MADLENAVDTEKTLNSSPSLINKLKTHFKIHKKMYEIIGIITLLILIFVSIALIVISNSADNKKTADGLSNPTPTAANSGVQRTNSNAHPNPMVASDELKRVEESFRKKYENAGVPFPVQKDYKFEYRLAPALQNKNSFIFNMFSAYAASSTCNIASAPGTVTGYLLKDKYSKDEAISIAKDFDVNSAKVSAVGGTDESSFSYYFSDPASSAYFTISENTGTYEYHNGTVDNTKPDITEAQARSLSDKALIDHNLNDKTAFASSNFFPGSIPPTYFFKYDKKFNFKLVDEESITVLGATNSVCGVYSSLNMNYINVLIGSKGILGKIVNNTRFIENSYSFPRESLEDSINEYKDNPIKPIVIGSTPSTGPVTIDEAVLVYFDYGQDVGQYAYTPMYLTSGKGPTGSRVFTLFPAVAESDLDKTPLSPKNHQHLSLQLDTFVPAPPAPAGKLCFGNLVDYTVQCTEGVTPICNTIVSLPSDKNDPFKVCEKGCLEKNAVISVDHGQDACQEFMKKEKLDTSKIPPGGYGSQPNFQGGQVSCSVRGCPC